MEEPVDVYANAVQVISAAWDITLEFSANLPVDANQPQTIERRNVVRIRMSPQHAKALVPILLGQIKNYEKEMGPIPLPPDMRKLWSAVVEGKSES